MGKREVNAKEFPQQARPFTDLRDTGLLWLINTTVLHPRGFALAFQYDDDGQLLGWNISGDGSEPWVFEDGPDLQEKMRSVEQLLNKYRAG